MVNPPELDDYFINDTKDRSDWLQRLGQLTRSVAIVACVGFGVASYWNHNQASSADILAQQLKASADQLGPDFPRSTDVMAELDAYNQTQQEDNSLAKVDLKIMALSGLSVFVVWGAINSTKEESL